ncbi:hypothetical protein MAR_021271 [Mya arenaria]|uniref:Uncharacterized protein n=1 Tax=Mya arenaria TaxID=6604 RepID=A0ABY7E7A8_MYAAR|nr:hypothetical protein MAR_021271 [Mya arenaria]
MTQKPAYFFFTDMKEAGSADSATTADTGLNRTTNGVTTQRTTQPDNQNLINGVEVKAVNIVVLFSMTTISVLMFLTK